MNGNIGKFCLTILSLLFFSHSCLEYIDSILLDERSSLNNQYIYQFLYTFFPKVSDQVLNPHVLNIIAQVSFQ